MISPVYAITDPELLPGEKLYASVNEALRAGVSTVQFRDKNASAHAREAIAARLLALCEHYQAQLIINDDVDLAAEIGATGVHLGRGDESIARARERLGKQAVIGATCHGNLGWAKAAADAGADYVAFGRFYSSTTKPEATTASVDILRQAKQVLSLPIVAIGGITDANAEALFQAGADSVAVCAGIFASDDITAAVQKLFRAAPQPAF